MPELPEVETIKRQLAEKIVGEKLDGRKITGVRRRAKILIIDFNDGSSLAFHLKLTGQLIFNGETLPHTRKVFIFNSGNRLVFNDSRKFGWWKQVINTKELEKNFGPEALLIKLGDFKKRLSARGSAKIKQLLMDQKFIAGIGNIYSDEILFTSKVHPLRRAKTLSEKEISAILKNIGIVLKQAIRLRGSSVENYLDACGKKGGYARHHKVYQREGEKCFRCGAKIQRLKIGGRSAHFCPQCQPIKA